MQLPALVVAEGSAKGSAEVSPSVSASERLVSSTARRGSPLEARAGRRPSPGGGRSAPARLCALLAPALLAGCGYTEFEWQVQQDKLTRLQRDLQSSELRIRELEQQGARAGAPAPTPVADDLLGMEGPAPGAGAQRGAAAGGRAAASPDSAVLQAFLPVAAGEVTVAPRDGQVVLSIPSRLLFKGNRDALSPAGEKTLRDIAAIIRGSEPLRALGYQVVGHTASGAPAATGAPTVAWRNGWDVTVAQARAVMLFLAQPKEAGVPLARLSLAAYADLAPADAGGGAPAQPPDPRIEIVVDGTAPVAASPTGGVRPATGAPATGAPATGAPATGAPATGAPATGAPAPRTPATGTPVQEDTYP
ncbi:uncharacterized protein SOCE26_025540 [Sorangium cellulosum]|uniref:OmpA-like domain-containing protein n=1 Tax=Sorangium cellulosum TaxID=56 RepID=A0A2L0EPB1_SORCE|nr:hypothetical protein [Sorangium cellulosum]AUX41147.1 uncharacterized protein SOCE26_025540 [Sorangium cellulosum]